MSDGNFPIAVWDLVLSSLPVLYSECLPGHLEHTASFLHSALLGASSSSGGEDQEGNGGRTARAVVAAFLHSEGFQEMRRLHETLLALCFEKTALTLPNRFGNCTSYMQACISRFT